MDSSDDERQKQRHRNRRIHSERPRHVDVTKRKSVNLSSVSEKVKDCLMDSSDDEGQKLRHQNRRIHSERPQHVDVTKRKSVNLSSVSESVKDCQMDSSDDEGQKLRHQNRRIHSERPQHVEVKKRKSVYISSRGESEKNCEMGISDDERKKQRHQNSCLQSQRPQHVDVTKRTTVNVSSGGKSVESCEMDFSDDESGKQQHQNGSLKSQRLQHVIMKRKTINVPSPGESVESCEMDFSDDERRKQQHQNRCFQTERLRHVIITRKTENVPSPYQSLDDFESNISLDFATPALCSSMSTKKGNAANTSKMSKISNMWVDVLQDADLWKSEEYPLDISEIMNGNAKDCESVVSYDEILVDFVLNVIKNVRASNGETRYEKRFREKLRKPKFYDVRSKFYIPPHQVELFYQMLTDISAQKCLKEICKVRKWSPPRFNTIKYHKRYFTTCILKRKRFTSRKPTLSRKFSKELAAFHCLNFLGLTMRKVKAFNRYLNHGYISE